MGKSQRDKGKRGEREAASKLSQIFGRPVARSQQFKGGQHSADLDNTPGLHVEVKRCERLRLYDALQQAADDGADDIPLVLHRANRRPWIAIAYLDDLTDLADQIRKLRE